LLSVLVSSLLLCAGGSGGSSSAPHRAHAVPGPQRKLERTLVAHVALARLHDHQHHTLARRRWFRLLLRLILLLGAVQLDGASACGQTLVLSV
jgi:hypothetical protein